MKKEYVVSLEIMDYIFNNKGISYLDLETYAYTNDKHDWLWLLSKKKHRAHFSCLLKSKHRVDNCRYNHIYLESVELKRIAEENYVKRNPFVL